jgi:hypothetical protein
LSLCGVLGLAVKDQKLMFGQGQLRMVVGELDFKNIRSQRFDDRADLAAKQSVLGEIGREGDNVEQSDIFGHWIPEPSVPTHSRATHPDYGKSSAVMSTMCGDPGD